MMSQMRGIEWCEECGYYDAKTNSCLHDEYESGKGCPLPEVEIIRHGRWVHGKIYEDIGVRCSCCDFLIWTLEEFENVKNDELDKFCPHCGAKMDEVSK